MAAMFQLASFGGMALVAVWLYVRFPNRRPTSIVRAMAHVVASYAGFSLLPFADHLLLAHGGTRLAGLMFLVGVAMPGLCYILLSWLWLVGRIIDSAGTPRGGHRVRLPKRSPQAVRV